MSDHIRMLATKGDPITLLAVAAIAVGAGGALTVAMKKDGFLTQLARVLEKYVERRVDLEMERSDGETIKLSGSAGHIRRILSEHLK